MKRKGASRFAHVGKDRYEKEAYRNFLSSKFALDKTVIDPIDTQKTNESSFEEEREEPKKVTRKSFWLKAKDFLYDNWVIAILTIILSIIIGGYISIYREQGVQGSEIETIKTDIAELKTDDQGIKDSYFDLKERYDIFSTEISKDIEYIKKALGF